MKSFLFALLALAFTAPSIAQGQLGFEDDWTSVLRRIVQDDGLVAYDEASGPDFDRTLAAIESFDPSRLTADDEKLAFWINAYNAKMVEAIAARPNARNLEEQNLFDELFKSPVTVAGMQVTLDQIEHVILRRQDGPAALEALAVREVTPLIHVGLNCAAVSCPPLRPKAFESELVRRRLGLAMRYWVRSPRFVRTEGGALVFSSLLDWFGTDFDGPTGAAGDFLATYLDREAPEQGRMLRALEGRTAAEIKALPNVRFEYDWTVARAE